MEVGIYEAKSRLSQLIEKVEAGEEVVLTRHGKPVARIVTVRPPKKQGRAALLRGIRALSRRVKIPRTLPVRDLLEDGRD